MIELESVRKSYDDLDLNLSLQFPTGRISGIVGRNGSGKTTLFRLLLDLARPVSGTVKIFEKNVSELSVEDKTRIVAVFSDVDSLNSYSITEILKIWPSFYPRFDVPYFIDQCRKFKFDFKKRIIKFSKGMKSTIKILVALACRAEILILDEPTAGLDVVARDTVLELIQEYFEKEEDTLILISSHLSGDLEQLCDDFYLIDDGQLLLHEDTDVLLSDYGVLKIPTEFFSTVDQHYLLTVQPNNYGFTCLTNQVRFYRENYPQIGIENGNIDDMIRCLVGREAE